MSATEATNHDHDASEPAFGFWRRSYAMVVKDGVFYYPDEVYPKFGIKPFAPAPKVILAKTAGIEPRQQSGGEKAAHFE